MIMLSPSHWSTRQSALPTSSTVSVMPRSASSVGCTACAMGVVVGVGWALAAACSGSSASKRRMSTRITAMTVRIAVRMGFLPLFLRLAAMADLP